MSPEPSQYVDVQAMLAALEADGAHVEVDGWKGRLVGNRPPVEQVVALHQARLPVLFHLVSVAPHRCATCEGVATLQSDDEWFCSEHVPKDDGRYELWQVAIRRKKLQDQRADLRELEGPLIELQCDQLTDKINHLSSEMEAIEAQIAVQES